MILLQINTQQLKILKKFKNFAKNIDSGIEEKSAALSGLQFRNCFFSPLRNSGIPTMIQHSANAQLSSLRNKIKTGMGSNEAKLVVQAVVIF